MTSYERKQNVSPFGNAKSREQVLADKGIHWKEFDNERIERRVRVEDHYSPPDFLLAPKQFTSSSTTVTERHSTKDSRSLVENRRNVEDDKRDNDNDERPYERKMPPPTQSEKRSDPFCAARPREEVLESKGIDSLGMDEKVDKRAAGGEQLIFASSSSHGNHSILEEQNKDKRDDRSDEQHEQSMSQSEKRTAVPSSSQNIDPFCSARPREEVLASKGVDSLVMDEKVDKRVTGKEQHIFAPSSSHTEFKQHARTVLSQSGQTTAKTKKANPFGAAKPREDVLASKGIDFRQVDKRIENKAAATNLTPEQQAQVETIRLELSKAEEDFWDANEHEMPEEKFRVRCEEKRRELRKRLAEFAKNNLDRQSMSANTTGIQPNAYVSRYERTGSTHYQQDNEPYGCDKDKQCCQEDRQGRRPYRGRGRGRGSNRRNQYYYPYH